jgi:hypothetical protein
MCLSRSQQIICLSQGRQNVFEPRSTDHLFEPQSGQNKGNKIGICCFSTKQAALRSKEWEQRLIRLFRIISIPSKFCYFRLPDHVILLVCKALDFRCQCTQQKLQSICTVLTFDPQLKKNLNIFCTRQISIKLFYLYQRLQCRDNYFFKIKFVFFLYLLLSASWKENDLPLYISDIRQIVGYRTPVFIQPFPWHLHITITYNLPHLHYDMLPSSQ